MKKIISAVLVGLFVGVVVLAPSQEARAQVVMSNRCCDAAGNVRCFMPVMGPVGAGCYCNYQGNGWVC